MAILSAALASALLAAPPGVACDSWTADIIARLADPDPAVRLAACRAARRPEACVDTNSPSSLARAPVASERARVLSEGLSSPGKVLISGIGIAPDPFSPEPDGFLDTTVLSGVVRVRHTDAYGSHSRFTFSIEYSWTILDAAGNAVRIIEHSHELPEDVSPGAFSTHDFGLQWNGRDGEQAGSRVMPDGEYTWNLTIHYVRRGSVGSGAGLRKIVGVADASGIVTIDASVGEALRLDLEEALIARLSDSEISVRRAAAAALGLVGRDLSIDALRAIAVDHELNDPLTRGVAAVALGGLRHVASEPDAVVVFLEAELTQPGLASYRAMVAKALGKTHDAAAVEVLLGVRDDTTEPDIIRAAASQAVLRIERMFLSP